MSLLLAAAGLVAAADPRCASVKTVDLVACAERERARADAALNAAYGTALAAARAEDAELAPARASNGGLSYSQALIAAERAWLAFRDAHCRAETYPSYDGHEQPIYLRGCLAKLTQARTAQLRAMVAPR